MKAEQRLAAIRERLQAALCPESLVVEDESHLHVGHVGARDGRGHFRVMIVSPAFNGKPMLARHRAVYTALGELMQSDIHALAIEAVASDEL
ncbi:MAG: BolA/IbaG family iron-sulfur metabolism protein [Xanthomonadales bacterium]|nr:BolA/IbaG family iron-sulfur metabolism protein [Xanthomonadales bacterium]NIN60772.1 BolA/IbaG family iron-sulfur metabolism protein [Xanthomonadales bacterium]NIN76134.1 BolA/IbaG family iron-sulfur metabolism protein [Xanthomonadales bacterium]NIO15355.1 BolA/IbaG family iron-sulfur metabolism protein [Xanthomonadales bacterium]NIP13165.1 BolA/IbaG family iron-sulfur metabolism protein [Xanthomonadales bacterium]